MYKNDKFTEFDEYDKYKHLGLVYPYMCILKDNIDVDRPALLMLAFDSKSRPQYRYNEQHIKQSQENKVGYVQLMIRELENAVEHISKDLNSTDTFTRLLALMAFITMKTGIRIGKDIHLRKYNSIGLSTLMKKNVTCEDKKCNFNFIGKKGVTYAYTIDDPKCVAIIRTRLKQCTRDTDFIFSTDDRKITYIDFNSYVKSIFRNEEVSGKDFRTLLANVSFLDYYIKMCRSSSSSSSSSSSTSEKENSIYIKESIKHVASVLQNTNAVSKKSYIFEKIIEYIRAHREEVYSTKSVVELMVKIFSKK